MYLSLPEICSITDKDLYGSQNETKLSSATFFTTENVHWFVMMFEPLLLDDCVSEGSLLRSFVIQEQ